MKENNTLKTLRKDLKENTDNKYKKSIQKFFKKDILCYGTKTAKVRKIAKKHFKNIKNLEKENVFELSENLLKNKYNEEALIAIQWTSNYSDEFEKKDFFLFEKWIEKYIDNWAKDDDFCSRILSPLIEKYPELIEKIKLWTQSENMWLRRASAVSLIKKAKSCKTKNSLNCIFKISKSLFQDKEDLVQKDYGWLLKAASINNQKQVFSFLIENKEKIPKVSLRYATEKMNPKLKTKILEKN